MRNPVAQLGFGLVAFTFFGAGVPANADPKPADVAQGDPWQAEPYTFIFGNHLDTHVQLQLKTRLYGQASLIGALYVIFTGETDETSGLPIARHPRGASHAERCGIDPIVCVVGWRVDGQPGAAKFLYHDGVNGDDHPVWMVNRAEEASAPAPGMVIPQRGYFSHFHWLSASATDSRAPDTGTACDKTDAGMLQDAAPSAVNEICQGWFLQLKAARDFAFQHGGELMAIEEGADIRTHLNIVTNYNAMTVFPITPTRTSDGGH